MVSNIKQDDQSTYFIIRDLFNWLEAIKILRHDLQIEKDNPQKRRIIFLDFSEIRKYCLPTYQEGDIRTGSYFTEFTEKILYGEFFGLLYIFSSTDFIKVILPPYALEMKEHLDGLRNKLTHLMIMSQKKQKEIVKSVIRILPKKDWVKLTSLIESDKPTITNKEADIIFGFLKDIFPRLTDILKLDWKRGLTLLNQVLDRVDIENIDEAFPDFTINNRQFFNRVPDHLKYFEKAREPEEHESANRYDAYLIEYLSQILEKFEDIYCLFATRSRLMIETLESTLPLYNDDDNNPEGTKSIGRNTLYFLARIIFMQDFNIKDVPKSNKKLETAISNLEQILNPIKSKQEIIRNLDYLKDKDKKKMLSTYDDLLFSFNQLRNDEDRLKTTLKLKDDLYDHLEYFMTSMSDKSSYAQISDLIPTFFADDFQRKIKMLKMDVDIKFKETQRVIHTSTGLTNENIAQLRFIVSKAFDDESILQSDLMGTSGELPYNVRFLDEQVNSFSSKFFTRNKKINIPQFIDEISKLESPQNSPTEFKLLLGYIYIKLNSIDKAVEVIEEGLIKCQEDEKLCFEYHFLLSIAKRIDNKFEEAYACCQKAKELQQQYRNDLSFNDARYLRELGQIIWYCNLRAVEDGKKVPKGIGSKYDAVDQWKKSLVAIENDGPEVSESPIKVFLYNSLTYAYTTFSREKSDRSELKKAKFYLDKFSVEYNIHFGEKFTDPVELPYDLPIRFRDTAASYYAQSYTLNPKDHGSLKIALNMYGEIMQYYGSHKSNKWYKDEIIDNNNKFRALVEKRKHSSDSSV